MVLLLHSSYIEPGYTYTSLPGVFILDTAAQYFKSKLPSFGNLASRFPSVLGDVSQMPGLVFFMKPHLHSIAIFHTPAHTGARPNDLRVGPDPAVSPRSG